MKKIDFHIHTVPSISDRHFDFDLESLKEYVELLEIDCIAITNHNLFDKNQYDQITNELAAKVFPGIEIDLEGGHLLLISENENVDDFAAKAQKVSELNTSPSDDISYDELIEIYGELNNYLLIPHYDKKPNIKPTTLEKLGENIFVGEVASLRKFKSCLKELDKLTPVIFSDCRFIENMPSYPTRQTYLDVEEISLNAIKGCLYDKDKVFLSKEEGNDFFQATDDGVMLSTGLNVIVGGRSSGKTYTLDKICDNFDNVKYLRQFSLLQNDKENFKKLVTTRHSLITENYLKEFKDVVYEINDIDLKDNEISLEKYLASLKKFASESDNLDAFSKCALYNETKFIPDNLDNLKKLISATESLIETNEYKDVVNKHITDNILKNLIVELINKHNKIHERNLKKDWCNNLIESIKDSLKFRSTTTTVEEIDFDKIQFEKIKVQKFKQLVKSIQTEKVIDSKEIRGFKVLAKTKKYTGASQLKNKSKSKLSFSKAFNNYENPYKFLISLKNVGIEETEFYKYFVDIDYRTLNKHGYEVSGGERSEFNLLHEISDALKHDLLLIDEPESSFDNIFLKNEVNELIKEIAKEIPVIVVTHNSTIGASINPNQIVFTQKIVNQHNVEYKVFFGHPTSKTLKNANGEEIKNLDVLLNCLEAGEDAYNERNKKSYEILKD
ncbi:MULTISPECIES: histidinol-phosphatase [Aequorivita]|uniref:Histidinol-phosphatase n=1 Tax=Aequorivita iocasae TaxID=2803865 RepID=A0ABX7DWY8_9FLAO|nr:MULTISPECIES: histidinol-phosphatase [Aequorivita]QQX78116.1 histidinol-phosphatase [Aequorivita iocasae]UCA57627.1 histidinol-phosphatase [Aequorivita sp. F7]